MYMAGIFNLQYSLTVIAVAECLKSAGVISEDLMKY